MPPRPRAPSGGFPTPDEGSSTVERLFGRMEGLFEGLTQKIDGFERRVDERQAELKSDMEQLRDRAAGWESLRATAEALERGRLDHEGRIRVLEAKAEHIVPRSEHEVRAAELGERLGEIMSAQQGLLAQQQGARLWLRDAGAVGGLLALIASGSWWLFQHLGVSLPPAGH